MMAHRLNAVPHRPQRAAPIVQLFGGDAVMAISYFSGADIAAPEGHITENHHASVRLNRLEGRRSGLRSLPLLRRDSG
jgi:hypothetical protein